MKLSDYLAQRFAFLGISRCFSVTGGAAMHLNHSFGSNTEIQCTYLHHEQACAIAAEGYARISGRPALVIVTSGPGVINALNGVFGAFTDSIPLIVISGQVKQSTLLETVPEISLRQLGDQEAHSTKFLPAFTKYFCSVRSASECCHAVDRAYQLATSGRPGPVWIEVPVDVQALQDDYLDDFINSPPPPLVSEPSPSPQTIQRFSEILSQSKRPLLLLGTGVRLSGAQECVTQFAEQNCIPVVTAWTHDTFDNSHPLFVGRPGTIGTRPGNFAVQSCDLLIVLGSRLNIRQVSYNWEAFAPCAKLVIVDIDAAELAKPYLSVDLAIHSDISLFFSALAESSNVPFELNTSLATARGYWTQCLKIINSNYSPRPDDYVNPNPSSSVNPYHFLFSLSSKLSGDERIICGDATACIVPFQVLSITKSLRMFSNSGCASMGYDLPAGIGASLAASDFDINGLTIILAGDGSLMMNLQELQSLTSLEQDILLFILDNNGYLSIKQTQSNFFGSEHGASPASGVTFPNFVKICQAFKLPVTSISSEDQLDITLAELLLQSGPRVCVIKLQESQEFSPRLKSKIVEGIIQTPELDDMFPHMSNETLHSIRQMLRADLSTL